MSKFTFEIAREHIKAGEYDKARETLMPIKDHPTAQKWLARLDEIDPPFPDELVQTYPEPVRQQASGRSAAEKFLIDWIKTMQAITLVGSVLLILIGIGVILYGLFGNNISLPGTQAQFSLYTIFPVYQWLFWGMGIVVICVGIYAFWRSNRPDIIRKQLVKMKPGQMKLGAVLLFGLAVFQIFIGTITKQTNQFGLAVLWVMVGLINWWQGSKAEKYLELLAR